MTRLEALHKEKNRLKSKRLKKKWNDMTYAESKRYVEIFEHTHIYIYNIKMILIPINTTYIKLYIDQYIYIYKNTDVK